MRRRKKVLVAIALALCLWLAAGVTDYLRVHSFYAPVFCVLSRDRPVYWDGGSGTYVGLGYSFEIQGSFFPDEDGPGVDRYVYRILGIPVETRARTVVVQNGMVERQ